MRKLFLWVNLRAGDLTLTRPLVRRILDTFDVQVAYGCWKNQAYIVEDLPIRVFIDPRDDPTRCDVLEPLLHLCPPDHYPIYLWVAAYPDTMHHVWPKMVEIYNRQVKGYGFDDLIIQSNFVPMVDFTPVEVEVAHNAVFIENGIARSQHSDFEFDMAALSEAFPQLHFYCTSDPGCQRDNIVDCSSYDLRVLSSIGNRCIAIAGKGSGPMCSTLTEVNRYKPRAILRYHPFACGHTLWDYPGNPMQYLETHEDVCRFLKSVLRRRKLVLLPGKQANEINAMHPTMPPETEAARMDMLIDRFSRNRTDPEYLQAFAEARNRLVEVWQQVPDEDLEYAFRGLGGNSFEGSSTLAF